MDILDEKFAITAFIARLRVQSKDLMFSISKNPQVSMVEVLAKIEKYINGEEALHSKQKLFYSIEKEQGRQKKRERSPKRQADKDRSPRRSRENRERSLIRQGNVRDCRGTTSTRAIAAVFTSTIHPSDSLSVAGPTRSAT